MKNMEGIKKAIIQEFEATQTLSNIQKLKNAGIELKELKSNNWQKISVYKLPLERFVPLYEQDENGEMQLTAIGIF